MWTHIEQVTPASDYTSPGESWAKRTVRCDRFINLGGRRTAGRQGGMTTERQRGRTAAGVLRSHMK